MTRKKMNNTIEDVIKDIQPINYELMENAQGILDDLTKPKGSLGRLEDFAKKIVGISGVLHPEFHRKVIFVMAGDHGVIEEDVSAYPQEVTLQMVHNFVQGGAGINVLAKHVGAEVIVVDMGIAGNFSPKMNIINKKIHFGTKNIAKGPAMNREEAESSIIAGIEILREENQKNKIDIIGLGEMGICNTTVSSAIVACLTKTDVEKVTGFGTGISNKQIRKKIYTIRKALNVNKPNPNDGIDVLSKIGGFEIGGLVGCILAAASLQIPIVIDGFISSASALVAGTITPKVYDYLFSSHNSVEKGHEIALNHLKKTPMFDLQMRLGEGTGAVLGINLIEAGIKILNQMSTFSQAKIKRKE